MGKLPAVHNALWHSWGGCRAYPNVPHGDDPARDVSLSIDRDVYSVSVRERL